MVDAYLYLGPRDLQLSEPRPAEISLDKDYMTELQRRATLSLLGDEPVNPGKPLSGESNPFLYDPDFLQKSIQEHCQHHPDPPCVIPPEVHLSDRPWPAAVTGEVDFWTGIQLWSCYYRAIFWSMYKMSLRSCSFALPNRRRSLFRNFSSLPELPQAISSEDFRVSRFGNLGGCAPS